MKKCTSDNEIKALRENHFSTLSTQGYNVVQPFLAVGKRSIVQRLCVVRARVHVRMW